MLDRPINSQSFAAWVEQFLVPTLGRGDIAIMDNLASHKGQAIRRAIRALGDRLLFLPPLFARPQCSPKLLEGPIEQVFAKLRLRMGNAVERSVEDCWQRASAPGSTMSTTRMRRLSSKLRLRFDVDGSDPKTHVRRRNRALAQALSLQNTHIRRQS